MTNNHANAVFQWQANLLLHKTKVIPVPKDYPIPTIPIYTKKYIYTKHIYLYKNKMNLWDIYTMDMKHNFILKRIISQK